MAAHQHWRIYITATNGSAEAATMEAEFRSTVGGADQASGGTPSASSQYGGFEASKAFDNNYSSTQWISQETGAPWWLRYSFAAPVDIVEFLVTRPTTATRAPKDFALQWSDNGADWTTLFSVTNQTGWGSFEQRVFSAPPPAKTSIEGEAGVSVTGAADLTIGFLLGAAEAAVSVTGSAALEVGVPLSGSASAAIVGVADLDTGTPLAAAGDITATPRGRFAGGAASPNTGAFFLLF